MKIAIATLLAVILLTAACGGGSSTATSNGPLTGNWQFILTQQEPPPTTPVPVSGFLQESGNNTLVGSVSVPTDPQGNCGGVVPLTGNVNGQNVSFSVNQNGTVLEFTGTIGSGNTSTCSGNPSMMSGSYSGQAGSCFLKPTTGTWCASLIPSISGSFSGYLSGSSYMGLLGQYNPIPVSGTLTQSANMVASNASVTGTIIAIGYPCFSTATLVGTVSGQNLLLAVYSYTGEEIGTLGYSGTPTTITNTSSGISLSGQLVLGGVSASGSFGPCPPVDSIVSDISTACLAISPAVCTVNTDVAFSSK